MKITKRVRTSAIILASLVALSAAAMSIFADSVTDGVDPLVSKSYIDAVVLPQTEYQVVHLTKDQILFAKGCLELIPRTDGLLSYSEYPNQGVSDTTHGTDVLGGFPLSENSYCIIPRGDGRGVVCVGEEAYLLVRGKYEIG